MSGKDNKELKNTSLSDSRLPIVAVKPLQFGHHAAANETGINFSSLTWGAQDTIDTDISNPSANDILNAHLSIYKAGVKIHSSLRGELSPLAYRINSTGIIWKDFVTEADEIFIITANNTWRTSLQCVDADILNATGTLAANATEIDFVKVIKLPRTGQPCPILVQVDESTMYMNTNNSTTNLDGDFYIKDIGNGFGRSIVLNSSATVARNYQITGAGVIPQSAEASVLQKIETLASQLDALIVDVAADTGNPESRYRIAPNSVDLTYFGDLVRSIKDTIDNNVVGRCGTISIYGAGQVSDSAGFVDPIIINHQGYTADIVYSPGRITFLSNGKVDVSFSVRDSTTATDIYPRVYNSSDVALGILTSTRTIVATLCTISLSIKVSSGDYLKLNAGQNSSSIDEFRAMVTFTKTLN